MKTIWGINILFKDDATEEQIDNVQNAVEEALNQLDISDRESVESFGLTKGHQSEIEMEIMQVNDNIETN